MAQNMNGDRVKAAMKAHESRVNAPQTFYIAELPDAYGYGVEGFGHTPEEAEKACRRIYFLNGRHGEGSGWQHRPWKEAKEYWGFSIRKATTSAGNLIGTGETVDID